jgi:hypothetical protein
MASNLLTQFQIPSFQQILTQLVQDYSAIANSNGFDISVDPNTEAYARLYSIAQGGSAIYYAGALAINANMIDTATGPDLDRLAALRGIFRKGATQSQGNVQFLTSSPQTIIAGTVLNAVNSLTYQVQVTSVYNNLENIPITSISTGSNTNLSVGTSMTWSVPPYNSQSTVLVSTPLTGGTDTETDDALRARLIAVQQYPQQAGNASQLINVASTLDPLIQQAFVYPNFNGLGTLLFCLVGNQSDSYIGRDIPHLLLDNTTGTQQSVQAGLNADPVTLAPYNVYSFLDGYAGSYNIVQNMGNNLSNDTSSILGSLPVTLGNSYATCVTTVNNIPTAMSLALSLPYPPGSAVNVTPVIGTNGWLNYSPWPNPDAVSVAGYCTVTTFVATASQPSPSANCFTINALSKINGGLLPTANVTQISWINRSDSQETGWIVETATITNYTDNGNNTFTVTISIPFNYATGTSDFYGALGLVYGDVIFPAITNAQTYLNNILTSYSVLGPGAITSSAGLLSLGAIRFPSSAATFPSLIDDRFLNTLLNNPEIVEAQFTNNEFVNLIVAGQAASIGSGGGTLDFLYSTNILNSNPTPNAPPNIYIPCQVGFYNLDTITYYYGKNI